MARAAGAGAAGAGAAGAGAARGGGAETARNGAAGSRHAAGVALRRGPRGQPSSQFFNDAPRGPERPEPGVTIRRDPEGGPELRRRRQMRPDRDFDRDRSLRPQPRRVRRRRPQLSTGQRGPPSGLTRPPLDAAAACRGRTRCAAATGAVTAAAVTTGAVSTPQAPSMGVRPRTAAASYSPRGRRHRWVRPRRVRPRLRARPAGSAPAASTGRR